MEGNIVGEEFEDYVVTQINTRQGTQAAGKNSPRSGDELQYLTNRNAWIKLASSVKIESSTSGTEKLTRLGLGTSFAGTKLAEKAVLFNTLSSYTNNTSGLSSERGGVTNTNSLWNDGFIYGIGGTEFGIQPPPGVISATVDSLNRGSIRKAQVTLKAHNRFQFDIIEILYLRLGFTMMLEWGWDKYMSSENKIKQVGNTLTEHRWFSTTCTTQLQMLVFIDDIRRQYEGNVDGFFGKVSNFTWNYNPDGTYDITIDLITVGDVIESIKTNTFSKDGFATGAEDAVEITDEFTRDGQVFTLGVSENVTKAASTSALGYFLYRKIADASANQSSEGKPRWYRQDDEGNAAYISTDGILTENNVDYIRIRPTTDEVTNQYYVRLGELLAQIENITIPLISNDGGTSTLSQLSISYTIEDNLITLFPNHTSLDPKICIFKPWLNGFGDIKGIKYPSRFQILNGYLRSVTTTKTLGQLMNIYINLEFIAGLLVSNGDPNEEVSLFKLLQSICDGINNALGGVNKLEPIVKKDRIIVIIDQTLSLNEPPTVNLEVYGYNKSKPISNFVKDIKFVSKITPQLASAISIGATAAGSSTAEIDGTAFSKWSEGLTDRFSQEILESQIIGELSTSDMADKTAYQKLFNQNPEALFANSTPENPIRLIRASIVGNAYASMEGIKMNFETFYGYATRIDAAHKQKGIVTPEDVQKMTNKNFSVWLATAFGGAVENLFVIEKKTSTTGNVNEVGFSGKTTILLGYETRPVTIEEFDSQYFAYNDTFITQGKGAYRNYINTLNAERYKSKGIPSSDVGFIPLSFELTLEGISGIKIYNKLNINSEFLPSNYPKALNFIITKVNHNISDNNWDTSLSTISVPKTDPYIYSAGSGDTGQSGGAGQSESGNESDLREVRAGLTGGGGNTPVGDPVYVNDVLTTSITSNISLVKVNGSRLNPTRFPHNLIYVPEKTKKTMVFLHHTAGSQRTGMDLIKGTLTKTWQSSVSYPLATHFLIQDGFTEYVFDTHYWSNHASAGETVHKASISVELGGYGYCKLGKDGNYYNGYGGKMAASTIRKTIDKCGNPKPYRGHTYMHAHTKYQIDYLEQLIIGWKIKHPDVKYEFNFDEMFPQNDAKGNRVTSANAKKAVPGFYSHNSTTTDKCDVMPQLELVQMLRRVLKDVTPGLDKCPRNSPFGKK